MTVTCILPDGSEVKREYDYDALPKPSSTVVIDGHAYEVALLDVVLTTVSADARMILVDAEPPPKN